MTGLCGVTLIGAALYLDLDSQYDFAEAPEFAAPARPAESQEEGVNPTKGDRLLRPVDIVSDKQTFKVPTIIKVGDKEACKGATFHASPNHVDIDSDRFCRRGAGVQPS